MQWYPYVVGNISIAQAHPPKAVVRLQATFTRGRKLYKVLGCLDRVSPACLLQGYAEAAGAEASTKALASALWSVRGVKPSVHWRVAQESFCLVSSSQGDPRNLDLCGSSQPVHSQKNRQP